MTERTFSIIKPDATRRNLTGAINAVIEGAGLRIVGQRRVKLTEAQAKKFYEVHAERPFYGELVSQMIAEPVVVQVLEGDNAVAKYREVMGATNPKEALAGTLRSCLLHDEEVDLRAVLRDPAGDDAAIRAALLTAIRNKPQGHHLRERLAAGGDCHGRMSRIGG